MRSLKVLKKKKDLKDEKDLKDPELFFCMPKCSAPPGIFYPGGALLITLMRAAVIVIVGQQITGTSADPSCQKLITQQ